MKYAIIEKYARHALGYLSICLIGVAAAPSLKAQDRNIVMNVVYPAKAFTENGGPVINLKNPPYNAKGDGVTDDTAAFVAVMDYIYNQVAAGTDPKKTIYLPSGTYLISDTVIYSASKATLNSFCRVRWVGQNRVNTTIQLKNNSAGFGTAGTPKAVLAWARSGYTQQGNIMWSNQLRNITINTGSGNPGAVGVVFMGANSCSMDNVTVQSGDGQGYAGFGFLNGVWSVQTQFSDLTVQGFAHGIRCDDVRETQPTFEYVTLSGQTVAGAQVARAVANFRKLKSTNTVPGIVANGDGAHVVVLDSQFLGGAAANAAMTVVDSTKQQLFVRNVTTAGYGASVKIGTTNTVATGSISEYLNGSVFSFGSTTPPVSMNLPIEEAPLVPWEGNVANWTTPEDYTGTDFQKIQSALNSGKPAILFPKLYSIAPGTDFTVPATVKQMDFMSQESWFQNAFQISEASTTPLFVEHTSRKTSITVSQPRTLVTRFGSTALRVTTTLPTIVHVSNTVLVLGHLDSFCPPNVKMYARSINEENRSTTNYTVNGGLLWVMGWKTEADQTAFSAKNGGFLEVLGGYQNMAATADSGKPMLLNDNSNVSFVSSTFNYRNYQQAVWETRGAVTSKTVNADFPQRFTGNSRNYYVPLYVGYDPATFADVVQNSGFETPAFTTYQYNPTGAVWNFTGNAGIQRNGSAFAATVAPEGVQTAFLQHNAGAGSMSQAISMSAGTYSLSFQAARRNTQVQPIQVKVDGVAVGAPITPAGSSFALFTTPTFTVAAGNHTVSLETTATTGDLTTFVDAVKLNKPLPNGGFETPVVTTFQYNPTGASWTFSGSCGVQRSGWGASASPEGSQTAFLQSNTGGTNISQSVNMTAGIYQLSFRAARRNTQIQPIQVKVDGVAVGSSITPAGSAFASYSTPNFTVTAGSHTITLQTTVTAGDVTSFVDGVMLMPQ